MRANRAFRDRASRWATVASYQADVGVKPKINSSMNVDFLMCPSRYRDK